MSTRIYTISVLFLLPLFTMAQASWENDWLHRLSNNRSNAKNAFYRTVSNMNHAMIIGIPAGRLAMGLFTKDDRYIGEGITWIAAQLANGAVTYAMKAAVNRPRPAASDPTLVALEDVRIHSFPSGHTSSAFALATSISLDHPKWFVIVPSYLYASLVGYSRCYLGVHYPSDVLVGAIVGSAGAWAVNKADHWLHKKKSEKKKQLQLTYRY